MPSSEHSGHRRRQQSAGWPAINFLPLTDKDYGDIFAPRWINKPWADKTEIRGVFSLDGAALVGADGRPGDYSGLAIPNFRPGATPCR